MVAQPLVKSVASVPGQESLLISDLVPLYRKLATDDQDSVRLLTIPDLIALAQSFTPEKTDSYLSTHVLDAISDKSWRVRYMVANEFVGLAEGVGDVIVKRDLVQAFVSLLKDNEAEVRTAGAGQIPGT